ncbi:HAMP domain-containing sensor histidine kinase [Sphingomonas sp. SUN039]|uniref:HAMP domain-containing sensor histidine kinase n=1 Tax=Sphingomonas sp. SUN039 TaxID=2937787 RepID=UPI0021647AE0|nr:HAMP domain-containing sensor histidine kinase [Sphingomonas sp. SUN039]UVO52931.1 HAMP domain-containing histidine kinase [Sphingomonas sp. SUN039]
MGRTTGRPIIAQIVLLVAGAVLLATAALFVVTFQGPPPFKPPLPLTTAAAILQGKIVRMPPDLDLRPGAPVAAALSGLSRDARAEAVLAGQGLAGAQVWIAEPLSGRAEAAPDADNAELRGGFAIAWGGPQGLQTLSRAPVGLLSRWHMVTLAAMLATLIVLIVAAWLIARTIAGPLLRLADAADATRALPDDPAIPVDGPAEVRRVAEALARMRDRLAATLATRTEMLTGIAHDMGTPLARLAFHVDALPEGARNSAQAEIAEVRAMIGSVLDFARDTPAEFGNVDIAALLRQVIAETSATLDAPKRAIVRGDAVALKRLFGNLVENALRYAGDCAVSVEKSGEAFRIRVIDHGPGLPDDAAILFEPFVRGEVSRNRATGGVGLGLAIARRVAEAHGGTIVARNRAEGGAEFEVTLPV